MNVKLLLAAVVALALTGGLVASLMMGSHPSKKIVAPQAATGSTLAEIPSTPVPAARAGISELSKSSWKTTEVSVVAKKLSIPANPTKQATSNSKKPKEVIVDPMARAALSFVGADGEAEQYWAAAINDPNLPADERKDLIEDLNEDGLSDPKHPSREDLPLILSRISLIEQLAPGAMDQVNADAFKEAYKDLLFLASGGTAQ